jgi:four helix bundle protein
MSQQSEELKRRTTRFALDVCRILKKLQYEEPGPTVKKQLAKSSTSLAANYRSACRARSRAEFISRLGIVVDECDESVFWLEFSRDAEPADIPRLSALAREANELSAIFAASVGTARANLKALASQ